MCTNCFREITTVPASVADGFNGVESVSEI